MKNKYLKFLVIVLAITIIFPQVALAAWWNPFSWNWGWVNRIFHFKQAEQKNDQQPIACTMDTKQCPDGSYVGRQGPKCEFAPCPSVIVGGDKDEHGCIGSAGYTWCQAKKKCLRTWEEKCGATGTESSLLNELCRYDSEQKMSVYKCDNVYGVDYADKSIQDAPTSIYNLEGKLVGTCGGMPGPNGSNNDSCDLLKNCDYSDLCLTN